MSDKITSVIALATRKVTSNASAARQADFFPYIRSEVLHTDYRNICEAFKIMADDKWFSQVKKRTICLYLVKITKSYYRARFPCL